MFVIAIRLENSSNSEYKSEYLPWDEFQTMIINTDLIKSKPDYLGQVTTIITLKKFPIG